MNGNTESALGLYRSVDGGLSYAPAGGTVDTGANTLTLSGVAAFSRWTAASGTLDLFADVNDGLPGTHYGGVAWGDYDNDGRLDLLLAGSFVCNIYHNNADGTFTDINAGLPSVASVSVAWCDYDNDGKLDFVVTGDTGSGYISRIYHNNGDGTFTDINAGLPGVTQGSAAWGDYDNDGRPDLLIAGKDQSGACLTRLYHNNGDGTFTDNGVTLPGVFAGSAAWGDYDNDGRLDLLLTGFTSDGSRITRICHNNGDGTFTDINAGLTGVSNGNAAWGDYDNDGRLDVVVTGNTGILGGPGNGRISRIYHNNGDGTFTDSGVPLPGFDTGGAAWGDYNNDGRLDLALTGRPATNPQTFRVARNEGAGVFSVLDTGLVYMDYGSSQAWGDYDNDGKLDLVQSGHPGGGSGTRILHNATAASANTPPTAPGSLSSAVASGIATLSWDAATDAETPQAGLTYNLRVGTTPGGSDAFAGMANAGGFRRVPAMGNVNQNRSWKLTLPQGHTYYWSVQAVDTAFAGGPWATEGSFTVPVLPSVTTLAITNMAATSAQSGGNVTAAGDSPVTARGVVWNSTGSPTVASHDGMTTDGSGTGSFSSTLTGLVNGQSYYVRAYATSAASTTYGSQRSFVLRDPATAMIPPGNALVFNGTNQYVQVAHSDELNLVTDHTLEVWFKAGALSGLQGLISKYQISGANGAVLRLNGTEVEFEGLATSGLGLQTDTWYHLAAVRSGANGALYVNGVEQTLTGTPANVQHNGDFLSLASDFSGRYFAGRMDEVRIWNRALGSQEVRESMHLVLNGDESGLIAYYDFDQTSGTSLYDRSRSAAVHNGTLTNMTGTEWTRSTIPAGSGAANTQSEATGVVAFSGTNVAMNFGTSGTAVITATRINAGPSNATILNTEILSPWWAVDRFGSGSFSATLTFTLSQGLSAADEASPAQVGLYSRATNSDGAWTLVTTASSVSVASQTATFNNVTNFGQFAVAHTIMCRNAISLPAGRHDSRGALAWGDYDNDGKLDFALCDSTNTTRIYRNNGDGTFTDIGVSLPGVYYGNMAWGDYDNDGYLDLAIIGNQTDIYHNNHDDTFTQVATFTLAASSSVGRGCLAWGDFDNDGRLDLLVSSGTSAQTIIYHNNGDGTFTDSNAGLPDPGPYPCVALGDYDNDGYLDFVLYGEGVSNYVSLYHNNGDGTFTAVGGGLAGVYRGNVAWGDYDNDGYLDLALGGHNPTTGLNSTYVYHNNNGNGTFTDINAGLPASYNFDSIAWGDYDNDGRLDLLICSGSYSGQHDNIAKVYRNNGDNTFTDISGNLWTGTGNTLCAFWGDYDNDGRLDLAVVQDNGTYIYRNNLSTANAPPAAPAGLSASVTGGVATLSWNAATDSQTPASGLSYNLRIGTGPGATNVLSGMANATTGHRRLPAIGNTNMNRAWTINGLTAGQNYYWSVQAIDTALAGGAWAAEGFFNLASPAFTARETVDSNHDGYIDAIRIVANGPLNDNFTGLQITVNGYVLAASAYDTGTGANDNEFFVRLQKGTVPDTGAKPDVQIVAVGSLALLGRTESLPNDTVAVAATDGAAPVLLQAWLTRSTAPSGIITGVDEGDTLFLKFSEALTTTPALVVGDFDLPVQGDSFGAGATIAASTTDTTQLIITLGSNPQLTPGGTYPNGTAAGSPTGIRVAGNAGLGDAAGNGAYVGTAVDLDPGQATVSIAWLFANGDLSIDPRHWYLDPASVDTQYLANDWFGTHDGPLNMLNNGDVRVTLHATCSTSTAAGWTLASSNAPDQFEMKVLNPGTVELAGAPVGGAAISGPLYSGQNQAFDLQFKTPQTISSGLNAEQMICVTITATTN